MPAARTGKESGESIRRYLGQNRLLDFSLKPRADKTFVYFPLARKPSAMQLAELKQLSKGFKLVKASFEKQGKPFGPFKESLKGKLSEKELSGLTRAFDVVGDIIFIELPKAFGKKERLIGEALLEAHPNIRLACRKLGGLKGKYRQIPLKIIAARKNASKSFETMYKEHDVRMKVRLDKVFFSPRLATERRRIAGKVKPGETVGVWFAGVGPFALVIARHSKPKKIIAIELNAIAARLLNENIALNNFQELIEGMQGDVKKIIPKYYINYFDRIAMPAPKGAEHFLGMAFKGIRKNGVIHFYQFSDREKPFEKPIKLIEKEALKEKRKVKVIDKRVIRELSKSRVQAVIDFKVTN
jgi:tRNA (guanine37-N1)-methyltransferase